MIHLSVDIEKMGNTPNGAIISIGAVFFDIETGDIGDKFYHFVSLDSEIKSGASCEAETILWWMNQNNSARSEIINGQDFAKPLKDVLHIFRKFIGDKKVHVWGNGCDYDNVAIAERSRQLGIEPLWPFYANEHVRTIVTIGRAIGIDPKKEMQFSGERHTALDDAIHQAKYISEIWKNVIFKNSQPYMNPPPGYQIVPIEPTEKMVVEGFESEPSLLSSTPDDWNAYVRISGCRQAAHRARLSYAAMLKAAPTYRAVIGDQHGD